MITYISSATLWTRRTIWMYTNLLSSWFPGSSSTGQPSSLATKMQTSSSPMERMKWARKLVIKPIQLFTFFPNVEMIVQCRVCQCTESTHPKEHSHIPWSTLLQLCLRYMVELLYQFQPTILHQYSLANHIAKHYRYLNKEQYHESRFLVRELHDPQYVLE